MAIDPHARWTGMAQRALAAGLALGLALPLRGDGQAAKPASPVAVPGAQASTQTAAAGVRDPAVEAGENLIGRALILRGFPSADDLTYDAAGHLRGELRPLDWTLAAIDIQKVERKPEAIELQGVRVAVRYNPDQHIFERHPLKDVHMRVFISTQPEARGLQAALQAIFSTGIDPALQRSMPPYWRHYFSPALAWANDELTGQTIVPANFAPNAGVELPLLEKQLEPGFTAEASRDHVKGSVLLRMTVGTDGVPRRITIRQPLGYGLDEKAVETAGRYRFRPGTQTGKPAAVEMTVNQVFDTYVQPAPH